MKNAISRTLILILAITLLFTVWLCPAGLAQDVTDKRDLVFSPDEGYVFIDYTYTINNGGTYCISGETSKNRITSLQPLTLNGTEVLTMHSATVEPTDPFIDVEALTIQSGTYFIDSIKCTSLVITGGSISAKITGAEPMNAEGVKVYLTRIMLSGAGNTAVASIAPAQSYNAAGAKTDDEGILYFYLPEGSRITSVVTEDGDVYVGNALTKKIDSGDPALFTKYVEPDPLPYSVSTTSASSSYINSYDGLTINAAGTYKVSANYNKVDAPILIDAPSGEVVLSLSNVQTIIPYDIQKPAVHIASSCNADVLITTGGETPIMLQGGFYCAAIQKSNGDSHSLTMDLDAALFAVGGNGAPGIGSGKGENFSNFIFKSGTALVAGDDQCADIGAGIGGTAKNVGILGGSIKAERIDACSRVRLDVILNKTANGTPVKHVELETAGETAEYATSGMRTIGSIVYGWFEPGSVLKSVTTADDKEYTGENDYPVTDESSKITLYPPQYKAYTTVDGVEQSIPNTYGKGLVITQSAVVKLAPGITEALSPIYVAPDTNENIDVTLDNLSVNTTGRADDSSFVYAPSGTGETNIILIGKNSFSTTKLREASNYKINFILKDKNASCSMDKMVVETSINIPVPKLFGKSKAISRNVLMNLPGVDLIQGAGSGDGSYSIVKHSKNVYDMSLNDSQLSLDGLIPAFVDMTIDKDSTLYLKEDSIFTLMGDSTITGEGKIVTDGVFMGDPDVNVRCKISATGMFGHPVVLTGVDNGYVNRGDEVTVSITDEEDFLCWEFKPSLPEEMEVDLTQKTVTFKADSAYDIKAVYVTRATGIAFEKESAEVVQGDVVKLKWSIKPSDATYQTVSFTSDDENVAQVSETGEVYGIAAGVANITVTASDGGFSDTCAVTVTDAPVKPLDVELAAVKVLSTMKLVPPSGYEGDWSTKDADIAVIVDNKKLKTLKTGKTELTFTVTRVTSKNPSLVKGKALGVGESVTIPVMVRKKKELVSTVSFGFKKLYLAPGEEYRLAPTLKPKTALDLNMYYRPEDLRIARVSGDLLVAMGKGSTALVATSSSLVTKKITVIVTDELQKITPIKKNLTVKVGEKVQCLVATVPAGLTGAPVSWISKNDKVAAVDEATGEVTGVKKGKTTITAKSGNLKAKFTINVK